MSWAYQSGQCAALIKLGYGPEDARKAVRAARKYMMPRKLVELGAAAKNQPLAQYGAYAYPSHQNMAAAEQVTKRITDAFSPKTREGFLHHTAPSSGGENPIYPEIARLTENHKKPILTGGTPQKHDNLVAKGYTNKPFTGEQHLMANSMPLLHELDETQVTPNFAFSFNKHHLSPDVIFREHNRVTTMPEGFEPVQEAFKNMRKKPKNPGKSKRRFRVSCTVKVLG